MKIPVDESVMEQARSLDGSVDELLAFLQKSGVSQMRSSLVLAQLRSLSMAEAKQTVVDSKVWRRSRERVVALHDELASELGVDSRMGPRR